MLPDIGPLIAFLCVFALVGVLSALGGAGWLIYWLVTHMRIVFI